MESRDNRPDRASQWTRTRAQRVLANSGAGEESFSEPQGWSLKWDGASFPEDAEGSDREDPPEPKEAD